MQSSLPAGWLAFTGRELNPLDRYERFQIIHSPFLDFSCRKGSFTVRFPFPHVSLPPKRREQCVIHHLDWPQDPDLFSPRIVLLVPNIAVEDVPRLQVLLAGALASPG